MKNGSVYRISRSDMFVLDQFQRWHEMLISVAERTANEFVIASLDLKFVLRPTELPVPDCDLTWGVANVGRTVQINPAGSAGDANVLSAIAEDATRPGRHVVLRQGRLQRNRDTVKQVSGGEFRHAFGRMPVGTTGSFGARGREWYLVCELGNDAGRVAEDTADFVQRCSVVRLLHGIDRR